jgi:transposase
MYNLGIDVHKHESQVAVIDEDSEIVEEVRVKNANLDEIAQKYAGSKAVIEATGNYFTIYDTLDEFLDVIVAHPAKTKAIGAAKVKNDRLDAKLL